MSQKNEQSQEQSNSKSAVLGLQHLRPCIQVQFLFQS